MTLDAELAVNVAGWGYARLPFAEIAGLRRSLPAWAVEGTAGHFFKHADEQSILAVRAVDDAMQRHGLDPRAQENFGVIAAPRFLGRSAGAAVVRRYRSHGAQGVTPHIISQHSLHSVSGAISVLLGCKGPNVGVGGGPGALDDAFLAQLTLFGQGNIPGVWLVGTGWSPEPIIDREVICQNEPVCYAFALAIQPTADATTCGSLRIRFSPTTTTATPEVTTPEVVRQLQAADLRQIPLKFSWTLNWGAVLAMELARPAPALTRAA